MTENLKSERKNHIENPVTIKKDKRSAAEDLFRIIPKGLDLDPDKIREERLGINTYEEKNLEDEFHKAADDYLKFCQEMGKVPQGTFYPNQE